MIGVVQRRTPTPVRFERFPELRIGAVQIDPDRSDVAGDLTAVFVGSPQVEHGPHPIAGQELPARRRDPVEQLGT